MKIKWDRKAKLMQFRMRQSLRSLLARCCFEVLFQKRNFVPIVAAKHLYLLLLKALPKMLPKMDKYINYYYYYNYNNNNETQ